MTAPIPVFPDATIFGTRRCRDGFFFLTPSSEVRNILAFLVIYYAQRHDIRLLVFVAMCNHIHWVGDDPHGNYPAFLRDFHARATEVLDDYHGRTGIMWEPRKPSRIRLGDSKTVFDKLLYVTTNPVKHGLVPVATLWPGLLFSPENAGQTITAECPDYLRENYVGYPDSVSYVVPVPAAYGNAPVARVRRDFRQRRRRHERTLRNRRGDRPYLGLEAALQRGPEHRPAEPPPDRPNRIFACQPELVEPLREQLAAWRRAYGTTRRMFVAGHRDATWPPATYAMHVWYRCPRAGP